MASDQECLIDRALGAVAAKRLFAFSILYLFLLFALLLAEPMIGIVPFAPVLGGMS